MNADLRARIQAVRDRLHKRAIALAHPSQNNDMGEVLQALALIMEMIADLDHEQRQIVAMLDRQ
ncbi:MAG: hypothetical protein ACR65U_05095 [Methylocystis sp.]